MTTKTYGYLRISFYIYLVLDERAGATPPLGVLAFIPYQNVQKGHARLLEKRMAQQNVNSKAVPLLLMGAVAAKPMDIEASGTRQALWQRRLDVLAGE